jgi:ABC-type branched-subunit amino acid transport system ATPase component
VSGGPAAAILETRDLVAGYGEVNILHGVSLSVAPAAFVSVIGPNGAGKSTLLKTIYGLLPPRSGSVRFRPDGSDLEVAGVRPHRLTDLGMNYVPQLDNIFPSLSIQENLEIGAYLRRHEFAQHLERVFIWFPMLKERRRARAGTLSGGQRHLLALARALMSGPQVLLLDEPSAGLSPTAIDVVFDRIVEINRSGVTIVMVEQNARRSLSLSSYGYVLEMGRNRYEGPGNELLDDPNVVELYLGGRGRSATTDSGDGPDRSER